MFRQSSSVGGVKSSTNAGIGGIALSESVSWYSRPFLGMNGWWWLQHSDLEEESCQRAIIENTKKTYLTWMIRKLRVTSFVKWLLSAKPMIITNQREPQRLKGFKKKETEVIEGLIYTVTLNPAITAILSVSINWRGIRSGQSDGFRE